jgi:hypothetical protein
MAGGKPKDELKRPELGPSGPSLTATAEGGLLSPTLCFDHARRHESIARNKIVPFFNGADIT